MMGNYHVRCGAGENDKPQQVMLVGELPIAIKHIIIKRKEIFKWLL